MPPHGVTYPSVSIIFKIFNYLYLFDPTRAGSGQSQEPRTTHMGDRVQSTPAVTYCLLGYVSAGNWNQEQTLALNPGNLIWDAGVFQVLSYLLHQTHIPTSIIF